MKTMHLDPATLEALTHGRLDLVSDEARLHASTCEECTRELQAMLLLSEQLKTTMREVPELDFDVNALVDQALQPDAVPISRRTVIWSGVFALLLGAAASVIRVRSGWLDRMAERVHAMGKGFLILDGAIRDYVPMGWSMVALIMMSVALSLAAISSRVFAVQPRRMVAAVLSLFAMSIVLMPAPVEALDVLGEWPENERVSLDLDNVPVGEALQRAAREARLDLVVHDPAEQRVTVHMHNANTKDVFSAILEGEALIVERVDRRVSVRPALAVPAVPTVPATPNTPATPTEPSAATAPSMAQPPAGLPLSISPSESVNAQERVVFGGNANVAAHETVQEAVSFGGNVDVYGHVVNDVVAFGGSVKVHCGAVIGGDVASFGGRVEYESPCTGTASPVVHGSSDNLNVQMNSHSAAHASSSHEESWIEEAFSDFVSLVIVFLLGLVMMHWAPARFATAQRALSQRPVRSFIGGILAIFAVSFAVLALCITIIGIPVGLLLLLGAIVAGYVGAAMVAVMLGHALPVPYLRARPVAQLALGLLVIFLVIQLPGVGMALFVCATLAAFGAIAMSRIGVREVA